MFDIYKVSEGDNIGTISNTFNIDPVYLYKINGFEADRVVKKGENIIVPKLTSEYFDYYTMNETSSLYDVSKKYGVDQNLLSQLNGLNNNDYIYSNQIIMVPKPNTRFYITKDGDTLRDVINIMNAKPSNILNQNNKIYLREEQLIVYKDN